jgi:hypothetical protein
VHLQAIVKYSAGLVKPTAVFKPIMSNVFPSSHIGQLATFMTCQEVCRSTGHAATLHNSILALRCTTHHAHDNAQAQLEQW